ncbi:MAG: hypothetical protein NTX88_08745 [Candidatus Atribacteria bacterium]|nr:hypothetical protein [Candidatus Atribacteria bacterium]
MNKGNSIFGQIIQVLQIFNRYEFERMVRETKSEMTLSLRGGKRRGNLALMEQGKSICHCEEGSDVAISP